LSGKAENYVRGMHNKKALFAFANRAFDVLAKARKGTTAP